MFKNMEKFLENRKSLFDGKIPSFSASIYKARLIGFTLGNAQGLIMVILW